MLTSNLPGINARRPACNKGRIVGQKRPLKLKLGWAIRFCLELAENHPDLALFNKAIHTTFSDQARFDLSSTFHDDVAYE